jgi:RNA polymerase sigma-70 factor (ECF subfamily)
MSHLLRNLPAPPTAPPAEAEPDDAVLVALAKADRQAFALLYRRYVDPVYRYCLRSLGDRELAEDATSQVFTKALAALPRCREEAFRSWLFTIAHNVIVDARRARVATSPLASAETMPDRAPEGSPEARALAGEDARAIRGLLAQLTPDQRQLLELRLAGLTDAEIARVLGRSHGAVRMSQHRAISRLRGIMGTAATPKEATCGSR